MLFAIVVLQPESCPHGVIVTGKMGHVVRLVRVNATSGLNQDKSGGSGEARRKASVRAPALPAPKKLVVRPNAT